MLLRFECPRCGKSYERPVSVAGKKARCKQCGEEFVIPAQGESLSRRHGDESRATPAPPAYVVEASTPRHSPPILPGRTSSKEGGPRTHAEVNPAHRTSRSTATATWLTPGIIHGGFALLVTINFGLFLVLYTRKPPRGTRPGCAGKGCFGRRTGQGDRGREQDQPPRDPEGGPGSGGRGPDPGSGRTAPRAGDEHGGNRQELRALGRAHQGEARERDRLHRPAEHRGDQFPCDRWGRRSATSRCASPRPPMGSVGPIPPGSSSRIRDATWPCCR